MVMSRRLFIGGVLAGAAVRTWPFRVYSFPRNIIVPRAGDLFAVPLFSSLYEVRDGGVVCLKKDAKLEFHSMFGSRRVWRLVRNSEDEMLLRSWANSL